MGCNIKKEVDMPCEKNERCILYGYQKVKREKGFLTL